VAIVTTHLDTTADRLLDLVLYYIPAEILIVIVVFLLSVAVLLSLTRRLPSGSNDSSGLEEATDPTTRPPRPSSSKQ
jgi:hypothetical protein